MTYYRLVISPAAKNDLADIYQYGTQQWGRVRSEKYLAAIKKPIWLLTQQPLMGTERPELRPDTRSIPVERHVVYYRVASNRIEIIRVLHGRQDPGNHLK